MAAFDSTTISGLATAAATVAAAALLRIGRKSGNRQEDDEGEAEGVSLAKHLSDEQRADFRERIRHLEQECDALRESRDQARAERDTLQHEVNYAQNRNQQLGGP